MIPSLFAAEDVRVHGEEASLRGTAWHVWVRKGLNAWDTAVYILLCQTRERQ